MWQNPEIVTYTLLYCKFAESSDFFLVMSPELYNERERSKWKVSMTAIGDLTHGAPVDGLGLVFVLGSVPHERQPFNSCQSAARDKQGGKTTEQAQERWRKRNQKKKKGRTKGYG